MGYETKVILKSIAEFIRAANPTAEEIYEYIAAIANAEGLVIAAYEKKQAKDPNDA